MEKCGMFTKYQQIGKMLKGLTRRPARFVVEVIFTNEALTRNLSMAAEGGGATEACTGVYVPQVPAVFVGARGPMGGNRACHGITPAIYKLSIT